MDKNYYLYQLKPWHNFLQIEKEMDLILKKDATKEKFINKWLLHFVPAILKYSESSHKKLTANLKSKQGQPLLYTI